MNKYQVKKDILLMDFLLNYYNKKNVKNLLKYKLVMVNENVISQFDFPLKIGDVVVEIEYSDNKKTFNECMVNILKQKKKMG